jgi:hypothetical protein
MESMDGYQCSTCDALHGNRPDAQLCCPPKRIPVYECERCCDLYETEKEAVSCCLGRKGMIEAMLAPKREPTIVGRHIKVGKEAI